ncbi:MAG: hypothetical protein LBR11_13150 [Deltaproteobacteria bacterium]|jgi:dissimilatory sulfite reductase (desulfoviridin) alpha/beta subunit|nr:hypothetical protein [Deltaproteobacteria bacterium]
MTERDQDFPRPPQSDLLELDLNPTETARAEIPNDLGNLSSDSTHPLTEAPTPVGAMVESFPLLEPILTARSLVDKDSAEHKAQAPAFFQRLSLVEDPSQIKSQKILDRGYSLAAGDNWPVFLLRSQWLGPIPTEELKALAAAARKLGGDRVCLGPYNELDIFFNDRKSLEQAAELAPAPGPRELPFQIMACPGLFFCPQAAKDTLTIAKELLNQGQARSWPPSGPRPKVIISVAGCPAGQGTCGLYEHSDLTFQGRRHGLPLIDQQLAALSPKLTRLVANCPSQALSRSPKPEITLIIDHERCQRCGWCVNEDPCLSWPQPQGGYFRLLVSGRRPGPHVTYLSPKIIWDPVPTDLNLVGKRVFDALGLWLAESQPQETLRDFLERTGRRDDLAQPESQA